MSQQTTFAHIEATISSGQMTKLSFERNLKPAIYGKFVAAKDYEELKSKGWFRFVSESRLNDWNQGKEVSKLHLVSSISLITNY